MASVVSGRVKVSDSSDLWGSFRKMMHFCTYIHVYVSKTYSSADALTVTTKFLVMHHLVLRLLRKKSQFLSLFLKNSVCS